MSPDDKKRAAALAALEYVSADGLLGVGTGSTVNHFIDALAAQGPRIRAAVSSSVASTERLRGHGIEVIELEQVLASGQRLASYVDGADEIDPSFAMIKGGGGALTREKIVAAASQCFVCIIDDSKRVPVLGAFPLPVEVIAMAVPLVAQQASALGATARLRQGFITDNGHPILDLHGLRIDDPRALETLINQWAGVVTVGLFAHRGADVCLAGTDTGVQRAQRPREL
ncbi:MAG: ribose-5-phosphate isomerase RpiA [Burkholderiaceae bacterium]